GPDEDGGGRRPFTKAEAQARHLRRAWRRAGVRGVLSRDWPRLRLVLALPAPHRPTGGRSGRPQGILGRPARVQAQNTMANRKAALAWTGALAVTLAVALTVAPSG